MRVGPYSEMAGDFIRKRQRKWLLFLHSMVTQSEGQFKFSHSVMSKYLQPHELQHTRLPWLSPTTRACSNSDPLSQWCHTAISSSVILLSSCLNLCQHRDLFQWVSSSHQVAKVSELQLHYQSFQWMFRIDFISIDWLDLLAVQGTLKRLLEHHNSKTSVLQCSAFFMV